MTTKETIASGQYVTKQNLLRLYKWLTVIEIAAVMLTVVTNEIIPSVITGTVIGCWLLASLFLFAHLGIKDTTHGV